MIDEKDVENKSDLDEPKSYIPYQILLFNEQIILNEENKAFIHCIRLAFDWANKMGLKGKKVYDFHLQKSDPNNFTMISRPSMWCKIECTLEERRRWDETQKINAELAIHELLKND